MTTAAEILAVAAGEVGYVEGAGNRTKYGKAYGMDGQAWCDMFLWWCFEQKGAVDIGGRFAYTPAHALWFQRRGQWGDQPRIGALVFFRFSGNRIHHVGIVTGIGPHFIDTIEGNTDEAGGRTGGRVMRRRRRVGIVGYGYPAYSEPALPPLPPPTHYPEDNMHAHHIRCKLGLDGSGYTDERGIDRQKLVSVVVNGANPATGTKPIPSTAAMTVDGVCRIAVQGGIPGAWIDMTAWVAK